MDVAYEPLDLLLAPLAARHRAALLWFHDRAGQVVPWPEPLSDGTLLASRPKGIYKPAWSRYALSVRQTLHGPYPDHDPVQRDDGTWLYEYFQENVEPARRDDEYTNRAMMICWNHRVPVGVMRQVSLKPLALYHVLGLARVSGWQGGYFRLEGFSPAGVARTRGMRSELELILRETGPAYVAPSRVALSEGEDARRRTMASIVLRRGQPEFRRSLLRAFGGVCPISGCNAEETLEAAHIKPYRGRASDRLGNGVVLRSDLHTLFDLGLVGIDAGAGEVRIAGRLRETTYGELGGTVVRLPGNGESGERARRLSSHLSWCGLARAVDDGPHPKVQLDS
jgi:putative restriction endonuclease